MKITRILIAVIVVVVVVLIFSSIFKKDIYIAFYYPDAANLFNDIQSDNSFSSLEECRVWINEQKVRYNSNSTKQDDYECGKNCNLQKGQKPYVCEETIK